MALMTPSSSPTKLFIITGDYSGDVHAARVAHALRKQEPDIQIEAVGGRNLQALGVPLFSDQSRMNRMGLGSVLGAPYHYFLGKRIIAHLKTFRPDAVLLIDYGVFNLIMAREIKKLGIPVFYFIPPQVWASRKGRISKIKASVDHVFCIFPFEEPLYQSHGIPVTYVGHPLIGELPPAANRVAFCQSHGLNPNQPLIGIFPGSRKMEIDYLLKDIIGSLSIIRQSCPNAQFVLAQAPSLKPEFFETRLKEALNSLSETERNALAPVLKIVENENQAVLSVSDALIAKSGTTTFEASLYRTPMVIMYKGHPLAYQLAIRLCYLPCIGLPNIVTDMDNPPVPELWQKAVNPAQIAHAILPLLDPQSPEVQAQHAAFEKIHDLFNVGEAPTNVASGIFRLLGKTSSEPITPALSSTSHS
jgi:lipid-A-disaccharide synthase